MAEKNLHTFQNLENFVNRMNQRVLTVDDFESAFKQVITLVEQILERQKKFEVELHGGNSQFREMVQQEAKKALGDLKTQTNQLFVEGRLKDMSAEQKALFNSLKNNVSDLLDKKLKDMHMEMLMKAKPGPMGMEGKPGRPPVMSEIQTAMAPVIQEFKEEWRKTIQRALSARGSISGKSSVVGGKQLRMTSF